MLKVSEVLFIRKNVQDGEEDGNSETQSLETRKGWIQGGSYSRPNNEKSFHRRVERKDSIAAQTPVAPGLTVKAGHVSPSRMPPTISPNGSLTILELAAFLEEIHHV